MRDACHLKISNQVTNSQEKQISFSGCAQTTHEKKGLLGTGLIKTCDLPFAYDIHLKISSYGKSFPATKNTFL